jgi:hypothetical protein
MYGDINDFKSQVNIQFHVNKFYLNSHFFIILSYIFSSVFSFKDLFLILDTEAEVPPEGDTTLVPHILSEKLYRENGI